MQIVRIEGINLRYSVSDTEDLGTRRGGSWMLLHAAESVAEAFESELTSLSTGASVGVFKFIGRSAELADLSQRIEVHLSTHALFKHGSFTVCTPPSGELAPSINHAMNMSRWRQLQTLSFSGVGLASINGGPCEIDQLRPASTAMTYRGKVKQPVSQSSRARRSEGMVIKQLLPERVRRRLNDDKVWPRKDFAKDFELIATAPPDSVEPKTLAGKLSVFYVDGDKFGKVGKECVQPKQLEAWDDCMRKTHGDFLHKLQMQANDRQHWMTQSATSTDEWPIAAGALRLETLLWGGDEMRFAVAGWCGLEIADCFFEHVKGLSFTQIPTGGKGKPPGPKVLTYSGGLVLCHHQAPISRITALTEALAQLGKATNAHTLHWLTLESFDHAGGELGNYLDRRFPNKAVRAVVTWDNLALTPKAVKALRTDLPPLKADFPRAAANRIVRLLASGYGINEAGTPDSLVARSYERVHEAVGGRVEFKRLWTSLHHDPALCEWSAQPKLSDLPTWIKLTELWDYAVPPQAAKTNDSPREGAQ